MKLKLYVFEKVLSDYTDGLTFAIAPSAQEARRLIYEEMGYKNPIDEIEECTPAEHELNQPVAYHVFGGG